MNDQAEPIPETYAARHMAKFEEAMRKKDERRAALQIERDSLLVVVQVLAAELAALQRSYEKDSQI